ncbi:uncharacterized protein LOC119662648 [Teleopsis dalmanni]|uniref:uncharacterized protein LOC119662648 n=1 Tax=Teleopsis dalmanni TaxID=139649 RepID=UPI000D32CA23|nr:uncharacterized protein LOC119662648 [Teleopsis dalmanni]XP_037928245.1 uncharacterized protein LOC119662648 [Teleopsis dalmanni]
MDAKLNINCIKAIYNEMSANDQVTFLSAFDRMPFHKKWICEESYENINLRGLKNATIEDAMMFFEMVAPFAINFSCSNILNVPFKDLFKSMKLKQYFANVITLELVQCNITDKCVKYFRHLQNLQSLSLAKNHLITGKYIALCNNLFDLDMEGCRNLSAFYFTQICRNLKHLRKLNVRWCRSLEYINFSEMTFLCEKLKDLKIMQPHVHYEIIAYIPKLISLTVYDHYNVKDELFENLNNTSYLQELRIQQPTTLILNGARKRYFNYRRLMKLTIDCDITDTLLNFIMKLKRLQYLKLKNIRSVTNSRLHQLISSSEAVSVFGMSNTSQLLNSYRRDFLTALLVPKREEPEKILIKLYGTRVAKEITHSWLYTEFSRDVASIHYQCDICNQLDDKDWHICYCKN